MAVSSVGKFACIVGLVALSAASAQGQVAWGQSYISGAPGVSVHGFVETYSALGAFVEADAWMNVTGLGGVLAWDTGWGMATADAFAFLPQSGGATVDLQGYHWYDGGPEFGWISAGSSSDYWSYSDPSGGGGGGGGGSTCYPLINGIVPNHGPGQGYLEIYGERFSTVTAAYMPGASYVNLIPVSDTQINASFGGLSEGQTTIALENECGGGNAWLYTVEPDPTPVINSVTPSTWQAGQQYNVTISGSGFGTSPSVSISAQGVNWYVQAANDIQISLMVTVDSNAPSQSNIAVTVTSNGYWGMGFQGGGQPQSQGGPTATVQGAQGGACYVPQQFNVYQQSVIPPYARLHYVFGWTSPTGQSQDLSNCQVGERVSYGSSGGTFYQPTPFPAYSGPDPEIAFVSATLLQMQDNHWAGRPEPPVWRPPYYQTGFQAYQDYVWRCTCYDNNQLQTFQGFGNILIYRGINPNPGSSSWYYFINKWTDSASINPLP